MADVVRFALPTSSFLEVSGVGKFRLGILDVPADDTDAVSRARYRLQPYDVTEIGVVDEDTPIPVLPSTPGEPTPPPTVRYFTNLDLADPESEAMDDILAAIASQGLPIPDASETVKGAVELATPDETTTGTDTVRAVTPAGVKAVADAITTTALGLDNVSNTSDADKPISTAQQSALDAKAPIASPTFTGTVGGITKAMVGLDQVNNTADANKPLSTASQNALDARAIRAYTERVVAHDGTAGGFTRESGWFRYRIVGGTARPTNMIAGDVWEHDA